MTIEKKPESVNNEEESAEPTQTCGPDCNCGKTGSGGKGKAIIAVAVLTVAAVLLARGLMTADEASAGQDAASFGATVTQSSVGSVPPTGTVGDAAQASLWGQPLEALGDLNAESITNDSAFLYLPVAGVSDESIRSEIEAAARKAQAQGLTTGLFTLSEESEDYVTLAGQTPVPCVLALVRGGGGLVVSGDITEAKLLEALVAASRPSSSCGPAGCAPGGC